MHSEFDWDDMRMRGMIASYLSLEMTSSVMERLYALADLSRLGGNFLFLAEALQGEKGDGAVEETRHILDEMIHEALPDNPGEARRINNEGLSLQISVLLAFNGLGLSAVLHDRLGGDFSRPALMEGIELMENWRRNPRRPSQSEVDAVSGATPGF